MPTVDITETSNINHIIDQFQRLTAPVSVSFRGSLIPFRTQEEIGTYIIGFQMAWDLLDDRHPGIK